MIAIPEPLNSLDAAVVAGAALLRSAADAASIESAPAPRACVPIHPSVAALRVLTGIQCAAAVAAAAGLLWFALSVGGPGLLVAFTAFVAYLVAWWAKLDGGEV
jgi:hypothetical protein